MGNNKANVFFSHIILLFMKFMKFHWKLWLQFDDVIVLFPPPGCKLSEFERVTALKVYNWFANRRKEMKRRANIGKTPNPCRKHTSILINISPASLLPCKHKQKPPSWKAMESRCRVRVATPTARKQRCKSLPIRWIIDSLSRWVEIPGRCVERALGPTNRHVNTQQPSVWRRFKFFVKIVMSNKLL